MAVTAVNTAADCSRFPSPDPPPPTLYYLPDPPTVSSQEPVSDSDFDPSFKYNNEVPIVIDNGSWQMRAGFAHDSSPRLICPPQVARYRDRKAGRTYTFCGRDVNVDATARGQVRTAFDGNVVTNFDAFEHLLDYTFIKLGLPGADGGGLGHPLVLTEAVCNPTYSRKTVSELIFEGYNAPSLAYGIDALFSFDYNGGRTGLVVSSGNTSTHVIPVVDGKGIIPLTTRLNWGGSQGTELMLKLLQLKYPTFPSKLQSWQAEALMMEHCYVSDNYAEEVSSYLDPAVLAEKDRVIQFRYTEAVKIEKSEEELAKIAEKRKESGRRLQEQAAKARLEKLIKKEQELEYFKDLQTKSASMPKRDYKRLLESCDFDNEAQLQATIADLEKTIRRARKQDVGPEEEESGPPSFDLLEVPDEELDDEQKKLKRQQRLQKSNYDARQRAKAEKEAERQRVADEERMDTERREADLDAWIAERRVARDALLTKIKDRARLRAELTDRKSLASQMRMKSIANLASDTPATKKRRRGPATNADDNDTFGANDEDWAVYRSIGTGGGADEADEEEEAELQASLKSIEAQLLLHDPSFDPSHASDAKKDWRHSTLHRFLHGVWAFDPDSQAAHNQMHLNIERIRVPEVVFQPDLAGLDQAGVVEIIGNIALSRVGDLPTRERLLRDVFCCGGNTSFRGFEERLRRELVGVLPAGMHLDVRKAKDTVGDAWRGAARWCGKTESDAEWRKAVVTRDEWAEKGPDYLKEHRLGNAFA